MCELTGHERFASLFSGWLLARSKIELPPQSEAIEAGLDLMAGTRDDFARRLMAMPTARAEAVFAKLEVLQFYLGVNTAWDDARELAMLASIRADLHRLLRRAR